MRTLAAFVALALLAAPGEGSAAERPPAPTVNYDAKFSHWGSSWGGLLDAMLGGKLFLDPSSSQPKGFLTRVYDGNPGSLADPTGTFLIFDGPRAAFRVVVPAWREVDTFDLDVLEATVDSKGGARLTFVKPGSPARAIALSRHVLETRAGMANVQYRSDSRKLGLAGGEFRVEYTNPDFASAFVSEIVLDGIGDRAGKPSTAPHAAARLSRLVLWQSSTTPAPGGVTLHSLLFRVSDSGAPGTDLAAAWLAHPAAARGALPLVVLVNDPGSPRAALEAMGLAGRPEFALASDLAQRGAAVLAVDLPPELSRDAALARLASALDQVLDGELALHSGLRIDRGRIGLSGYGGGATLAMRAALADPRYRFAALSHVPDASAGDFLERWGGRRLLVVTDRERMAWWLDRRARGGAGMDVFAASAPVPGRDERRVVVDFLTGAAVSPPEAKDRVHDLASSLAQAQASAARATRSRREFEAAARASAR